MSPLAIIILAAGKGTRMPTDLPKMLQPVGGIPLVSHVLRTARELAPERLLLVLGHRADEVQAALEVDGIEIVLQSDPRGTGHAVQCAQTRLDGFAGDVLILCGDVPLLRVSTLRDLLEMHGLEGNAATILSATLGNPSGYGRIVRDGRGFCARVVEQCDLAPDEDCIAEINSGVIAFGAAPLFAALTRLRPENRQGEYYLTDVIAILRGDDARVGCSHLQDPNEILGVNTPEQLREVERAYLRRQREGGAECPLCMAGGMAQPLDDPGAGSGPLLLTVGEQVCMGLAPRPFNSGHLIVFPRRHVTSWLSLSAAELAEMARWIRSGEDLLARVCHFDALNLGYNSGAGEHLAFQLIPRWRGDLNFLPLVSGLKLVPESPRRTWQRLREGLR